MDTARNHGVHQISSTLSVFPQVFESWQTLNRDEEGDLTSGRLLAANPTTRTLIDGNRTSTMRIVSWNMNRLVHSEPSHKQAWDYIQHELRADLALVQEASPPESFTTKVYSPIGEGRYNWGSAVVALRPDLVLKPRLRISLQDSLPAAVAKDELPDSHPGASAVADVMLDGHRLFTAISLYAPWEMMPGGKSMFAGPRLHQIAGNCRQNP